MHFRSKLDVTASTFLSMSYIKQYDMYRLYSKYISSHYLTLYSKYIHILSTADINSLCTCHFPGRLVHPPYPL